jgi:SnoaL-like protein
MSQDLVRKIADTLEIQNLKATYCQAADAVTRDAAGSTEILRSLFIPEVNADYGVAICEGRDALVGYLVKMIGDMNEWLMHGLQTPRIEVDGDSARGEWVVMVQIKQRQLSGKEMLVGRYIDEFVRTPEGWRISDVKFAEEGVYPQIDVTSQPVTEPYVFR